MEQANTQERSLSHQFYFHLYFFSQRVVLFWFWFWFFLVGGRVVLGIQPQRELFLMMSALIRGFNAKNGLAAFSVVKCKSCGIKILVEN
jgi:hypothetical protein